MYIVYETQKLNSVGNQVKQIQRSLPSWVSTTPLEADGIFGRMTELSVKSFQEELGLYPDGIVGSSTGTALGIWTEVENGFDASHYNKILWDKVPQSVKFAYLKATEGATYADSTFRENAKMATDLGLSLGAYHFTKFANSPYLEAANFLNETSNLSVSDVFLDLEYRKTSLKSSAIAEWVVEICKTINGVHTDAEVGIYTSKNYLREMALQPYTEIAQYKLWAADWKEQPYVYPWETWHSWQYSSTGQVDWAEGNLDLNYRTTNQ